MIFCSAGTILLAAEEDVGLAVEAGLHERLLLAAEVLGVGGQVRRGCWA